MYHHQPNLVGLALNMAFTAAVLIWSVFKGEVRGTQTTVSLVRQWGTAPPLLGPGKGVQVRWIPAVLLFGRLAAPCIFSAFPALVRGPWWEPQTPEWRGTPNLWPLGLVGMAMFS